MNDETEAVPEDQAKRDGAPESALGGGEDVIEAITFKGGDGERLGSLSNGEGDEFVAIGGQLVFAFDDFGKDGADIWVQGVHVTHDDIGNDILTDKHVGGAIGSDEEVGRLAPGGEDVRG